MCESGCTEPPVARIGNAWLCAKCLDSMVEQETSKAKEPQP